ncbi:MAG: Hsp20/alpha crystallin family protein [Deltaproteobacteria bacterium]|nr:Hsp20/alpha crystallin family protein [Candidatus Zymogenaceae bacterium]
MKDKELEVQKSTQSESSAKAEGTREGVYYRPRVDIYETEKELTLLADLPGVDPKNLEIDLRDDTLTILGKADVEDEERRYLVREYGVGNYQRQFTLSEVIDQEKISAQLTNGVLTLVLPKVEKAKPRKIAVS